MRNRVITNPVSGDTPLHTAIRSHCSTEEFAELIKSTGHEQSTRWARTVNDAGELPISLCLHGYDMLENDRDYNDHNTHIHFLAHLNASGYKAIYLLLLPITTINPFARKLSDSISFNDACLQFKPEPGSQLYQNMKTACDAINLTRQMLRQSSTHPTMNSLPFALAVDINNKIIKMRSSLTLLYWLHGIGSPEDAVAPDSQQMLAEHYKMHAVGNCQEFAETAAYYLAFHLSTTCEIVNVKQDTHGFAVIGRNPGSDLSKPETWGKDAVICDAWAGEAFPANAKDIYLWRNLGSVEAEKNLNAIVIPLLNTHYHQLQLIMTLKAPSAPASEHTAAAAGNSSLFSAAAPSSPTAPTTPRMRQ